MFHVVLFQPEIPPNTGAIIRLCGATKTQLHLIGPLGFRLDEAAVRRAGMDYQELAEVKRWSDWSAYQTQLPADNRTFVLSTHGRQSHTDVAFKPGDRLLFGSEGSGLPETIRTEHARRLLRIPMVSEARSLNLAVSVSIVLYEALRQVEFEGLS
ncbi:MAG: tRNA (cytidine(34)-2'-O)-methyltransferase [Magnetococcales bacterium]|nr:tRNA (cytidine(34)-2'-O)-methyltransferase [Magnetococcales bacterium]